MCLQITQFCSGSTKPLIFAGGFLSLFLAIAIGYTGCTTHALYNDIDPQVAGANSISYYMQLATAGYLTLVTIFSCYAAHYDQKHSIRALSLIATLNLILALAAIFMMQPHHDVSKPFIETLQQASQKYDRSDRGPPTPPPQGPTALPGIITDQIERQEGAVMNISAKARPVRYAEDAEPSKVKVRDLTKEEATRIWDRLQARGCCGINNATVDWKPTLPKSCCAQPIDDAGDRICKEADANHQQGCVALIDSTGLNLLILLALIALVNFYLAIISGISAYRTYHYNEASQSAYT